MYDITLRRENGTKTQLSVRNVPILVYDNRVGVYLIATDITERARSLAVVKESEEHLRILLAEQRDLHATIQQLSTPVLPVQDHVLLMPLIGQLNSERSSQLSQLMLEAIERHHARIVIIDITGVPFVDTEVAGHLISATTAARLLGAESVLVGIMPEVAQTLVQLGVDLSSLTTRSNLQAGVDYALQRRGLVAA